MDREQGLPAQPLECRQAAEACARGGDEMGTIAWAISGQLAELLRQRRR